MYKPFFFFPRVLLHCYVTQQLGRFLLKEVYFGDTLPCTTIEVLNIQMSKINQGLTHK